MGHILFEKKTPSRVKKKIVFQPLKKLKRFWENYLEGSYHAVF